MNQSHNPETGSEHATGRKNRLARESSPYLLLHQSNPVDWYPWGPEALEKARRENKPIFLSIGYSTCYWCHVMERESFSDPEIAALMNRFFVNVKVDREERPDLDDIYMTATQVLTGHGGWPNSLFLTPDLKPFYAGTYIPPHDRQGRSGFTSLVRSLSEAWRDREAEIRQHADEVAATLRRFLEERVEASEAPPPPQVASASLQALASSFDPTWGGFGPAPKFPTPSNLFLLLELADEGDEGREAARMLHETLDRMARGGIYDQLGGGFHRYSTDREWKVPHFEKMLYDNGFLLEIYAREHARNGDPEMARVARETAAWIAREMTSPQGAFYSAIDAETDAREGAYYVWSREELKLILGGEDWQFLAPLYGFEGAPSFEGVDYVLHLPKRLDEVAQERRMSPDELAIELAPLAGKLFKARDRRERPLTDDKVLTGWNGIAIAGLAHAGRLLEDPKLVEQARHAARFLLDHLWPQRVGNGDGEARGPLLHTWRQGKAKLPAFLSDYVFLVRGLLALHEATGERSWLDAAADLTDEQIERLGDPRGGFFDASQSGELLFRTREIFDGALPAGNSVAALNLLALADRLDGARARRFRQTAERTLEAFGGLTTQYPDAVRMMAVAAHRLGAASEVGSPEVATAAPKTALEAEARQAVRLTASFHGGAEDGWRPFRVELAIQDGWHVNANPASRDFLVPTRLEAKTAEMRNLSYPGPSRLETAFADGGIAVYEGTVGISGELRGEPAVELTYQVCDAERCLRPTTVELAVE